MPKRTGLDTMFDNSLMPTRKDLLAMAAQSADPIDFPLDPEDEDQLTEGVAGEFGNRGEGDHVERNTSAVESTYEYEEMDEEDFQAAISAAISNAENYVDMELSPDREQAAKYYRAEVFGNETDGRSAFVMSEVRDTVLALLPSLLRIFCGAKEPVTFMTNPGTPTEQGIQQTAYISHIVNSDNDGFMNYWSAFKDALVRKAGIFTWWFEEKETVEIVTKTGLNEAAYALEQLEVQESSSEDVNMEYEIVVTDERPDTTEKGEDPMAGLGVENDIPPEIMEMTQQPMPEVKSFIRDIRVYTRKIIKRHRVAVVPPEEFILSPIASSNIDEYPLVGRRQMKTIGELVAIGHDEDLIREKIGGSGSRSSALELNAEAVDRQGTVVTERLFDNDFASVDPSSEYVKYCCVYVLIDADGDGIRERHKVCTVGDDHQVIYDEITGGMVPYAVICPDPEPHTPFGYSIADHNMDFQEVKSEMVRGVLDSLAQSIVGRTAIVEGKVNIDDALSNDREQVIRTREQGAIWSLSHPFTGMNAIPVLQYLDQVQAKRTGVYVGATGGLTADVLQSTATEAAQQMVESTDERPEMIARIFAETGLKRMYRGLVQQVVKHQDVKRVLRLRGREVTIDPREFNTDLDIQANVGLGRGSNKKRIQALSLVLAKQEQILKEFGADNEFVTMDKVSNAIDDFMYENEISDVGRYFNTVSPARAMQLREEARNRQPPPSPEQLLYQAQSEKTRADAEKARRADMVKIIIEAAKLASKEDKDEQDYFIKAAELLGKFGVEVNKQELEAAQATDEAAERLANMGMAQGQQALAPPAPNGAKPPNGAMPR